MTRLQRFTSWVICLFRGHEPTLRWGNWPKGPLHCARQCGVRL